MSSLQNFCLKKSSKVFRSFRKKSKATTLACTIISWALNCKSLDSIALLYKKVIGVSATGLLCTLVTSNVKSMVFEIYYIKSSLPDVEMTELVGFKEIDNLKGFRPIKVSTMGNYSAVLYLNLKSSDEDSKPISELTKTDGLGSLEVSSSEKSKVPILSKDSMREQSDFKLKPLISEESIVAVYRLNDSSTAPFVILSSAMIENDGDSKLMSIYFDLDLTPDNETHLIINARFEKKSLIKKYKLQNMSLEVTDAGRVHMKKTKIVLTGIDSQQEIPLSKIFKTNIWRIFLTWLLFLSVMLSIFAGGAYFLIRQFNEEHPNRYYSSPRRTFVRHGETQRDIETKGEDITLTA